jgi:hypothetical protein
VSGTAMDKCVDKVVAREQYAKRILLLDTGL